MQFKESNRTTWLRTRESFPVLEYRPPAVPSLHTPKPSLSAPSHASRHVTFLDHMRAVFFICFPCQGVHCGLHEMGNKDLVLITHTPHPSISLSLLCLSLNKVTARFFVKLTLNAYAMDYKNGICS